MSDQIPDWRPIHSPGFRSGDLVFYSHRVSLEVIPDIGNDGIFSQVGKKEVSRAVVNAAMRAAKLSPGPFHYWEKMRPEARNGLVRSFLRAFSHFHGLITPTRYRFYTENPDQNSLCDIEIGITTSGTRLASFRAPYDFAGRVVHKAIEMTEKRPKVDNRLDSSWDFKRQVDALMIALTMFPHEFFEKVNEWLLPGVYIDFNERFSEGIPITQFGVMSPNKRNIAHVDLPSARAAHEAAVVKGNKESWTRTRFIIGE